MDLFNTNLAVLRLHNPALADRVTSPAGQADLPVTYAKSGDPVFYLSGIYLHSSYDPVNEAKRIIDSHDLTKQCPILVLGLGLAYHIKELRRRTNAPIIVFEKSIDLLRTALKTVDLTDILGSTEFIVGETPKDVVGKESVWKALREGNTMVAHSPSLRHGGQYYNELIRELDKIQSRKNKGKLKVLVVSPLYGGSLPIARYATRALRNIGCQVELLDNSPFYPGFELLENSIKGHGAKRELSESYFDFLSRYVFQKAVEFQPDLVFALAQAPLNERALKSLSAEKIKTAFWFVENYKLLTYWKQSAAFYDYYFTIQKGDFFNKLKAIGVHHSYYLPVGCDPEIHRPVELTQEEKDKYGCDISFAGLGYYNRIATFRGLLDFKNFKIWGTGWNDNGFAGVVQNRGDRFDETEMVKIYNGTKINLNLHSSTYATHVEPGGDFVNPRAFELASAGAFQLVDERSELSHLFDVGQEVICFKDLRDLREKIVYYLDRPEQRARIAGKARERALSEHTYEARMKEMLRWVFSDGILQDVEKHSNIDSVKNLLAQVQEDHDLYPLLKPYAPESIITIKQLIGDQYANHKYQSDTELVLCYMNDLLNAGRKR